MAMMSGIYHFTVKKDYAKAILDELRKDDAIEDITPEEYKLSNEQK